MRRLCAIAVILVPLAVTAAQARNDSGSAGDLRRYWDRTLLMKRGETNQYLLPWSSQGGYGPIIASKAGYPGDKNLKNRSISLGKDIDLWYVDWDKIKAGTEAKSVNAETLDDGEENGDGEQPNGNGQKTGEDENDEGGGGWDRLWDAPKLG